MEILAHLDAMQGLGQRMASMAASLQGEAATKAGGAALGSGDAAGAYADFVSGWSHGRSEIADGLTTSSTSLAHIVANYTHTDTALAAAYDGSGG